MLGLVAVAIPEDQEERLARVSALLDVDRGSLLAAACASGIPAGLDWVERVWGPQVLAERQRMKEQRAARASRRVAK